MGDGTVASQGRQMLWRPVALIGRPPVVRPFFVERHHDTVTRYLGQDRRCRDGRAATVALDDRRTRQIGEAERGRGIREFQS